VGLQPAGATPARPVARRFFSSKARDIGPAGALNRTANASAGVASQLASQAYKNSSGARSAAANRRNTGPMMRAPDAQVPPLQAAWPSRASTTSRSSAPTSSARSTSTRAFWVSLTAPPRCLYRPFLPLPARFDPRFEPAPAAELQVNPDRPHDKLPYRGAWLWIGPEMIHLMELPNPDPLDGRPAHGGRDRHFCVGVQSVEPLVEKLGAHDIEFTKSMSGRPAVFFRDPDMNCLEVGRRGCWPWCGGTGWACSAVGPGRNLVLLHLTAYAAAAAADMLDAPADCWLGHALAAVRGGGALALSSTLLLLLLLRSPPGCWQSARCLCCALWGPQARRGCRAGTLGAGAPGLPGAPAPEHPRCSTPLDVVRLLLARPLYSC
jgi:hypothetical protein